MVMVLAKEMVTIFFNILFIVNMSLWPNGACVDKDRKISTPSSGVVSE